MFQAESVASSCECDNTAAIIGGVVAVVLILAITAIVIVVLRGKVSTSNLKNRYNTVFILISFMYYQLSVYRELADVPAATDQAVELSKFSETTYV